MSESGQIAKKWDAVPQGWLLPPTQFDFRQHDGLFTAPDGDGGTVESLERYWEADTAWERRLDQITLSECLSYARPAVDRVRRYKGDSSGKVLAHNIRAIEAGAVGDLTDEQWSAILDAFGQRCAYCGSDESLCLEHVIPISQGGGTTLENVVPGCRDCNSRKHTRTPREWLPLGKFWEFEQRHETAISEVTQ